MKKCSKILPDGKQCRGAALRDGELCVWHDPKAIAQRKQKKLDAQRAIELRVEARRKQQQAAEREKLRQERRQQKIAEQETAEYGFALPEHLFSLDNVTEAIDNVTRALQQNRIDAKRCTAMLYALQLAATNVRLALE